LVDYSTCHISLRGVGQVYAFPQVCSRGRRQPAYHNPVAASDQTPMVKVLPMRILVVEDEKKVASFMKQGLEEEGYAVDVASDGAEGLAHALAGVHDLIILDIRLPKMDGLRVLQALRQEKVSTPVLLLTVRATIEDKVLGLDAGADDYLTKPFAFQ